MHLLPRRSRRARSTTLRAAACLALIAALSPAMAAQAITTGGTGAPATATRPTPSIVGGDVAPAGSWPAHAALLAPTGSPVTYAQFCGGTLINSRWVLTAAHCVMGLRPVDVVVAVGIKRLAAIRPVDRLAVDLIKIQPQVKPGAITITNDIALLRLAKPHPGPYARLIGPAQDGRWGPGSPATVTGWGLTTEGGTSSPVLRQVGVPIVSDATCKAAYAEIDQRSNICAGWPQGGRDACQGDSGGPLWVRIGATWYQVGVVSSGDGCARPGRFGTYADVRNLRGFITRITGQA